ncbi:MAG: TMEM165/GDT1 family protein, partial [Chloroflexi bacterium]|nr:TMEM165/GDT1 family protein [Chloroflexota bacterium]
LGTWLGSTFGMGAADAIAIALGVWAGHRLPQRPIKLAAAAIFVGFGVWIIISALLG